MGAILSAGSLVALFDSDATTPAEPAAAKLATSALTALPNKTRVNSLPQVERQSSSDLNFNELQSRLTVALTNAARLHSYTTVLEIQEEVNDTLRPAATVDVKIRREPFSVYMRWQDNGQEALYVHGANDNCLVVKPRSGLAIFKKVWRLDPNSRLAKQTCRYPITDSGLERLALRVQEFYGTRTDWPASITCTSSVHSVDSSDVTAFEVVFRNPEISPVYSRCRYCFDQSSGLLVALENFGWSDINAEPRLLERYVYRSINTEANLTESDFDTDNPTYAFASR